MTTNEKIAALRAAAQAAGADGVILMTSDPHSGEYLPAHYCSLTHFSGFTGENSTLVVTGTGSALWVDGRFYVQADKQLAGTEIQSMHAGAAGVPTVEEYLKANAQAGQTFLTDGSCMPTKVFEQYRDTLASCGATLKSQDVVSPLWADVRPALPDTPCFLLSREQTGATASEKGRPSMASRAVRYRPLTITPSTSWGASLASSSEKTVRGRCSLHRCGVTAPPPAYMCSMRSAESAKP